MPLEDDLCDIIKKARTGLELSLSDASRLSGLSVDEMSALERGDRPHDREQLRVVAKVLGLREAALENNVFEQWVPRPLPVTPGIETVHGDINGYAVKGYILHESGEAVLVDTGYNPATVIETLNGGRFRLVGICLTHGHADHAEGIRDILRRWPVPVYLGADDHPLLHWKPSGTRLVDPDGGRTIAVGGLSLRCIPTPGHTPGGMCYLIDMSWGPVCFVGDTLFAGSIGRSNPFQLYATHLESVRRKVLALPEDCLLLPGHGPGTTVGEELAHNPFYTAK
ncbi:MBL fold metallo-hydrolase [Petrachloros mirabilis]